MGINAASASEWSWADLHETGPEAESRAAEAERQRREVEDAYLRGVADGERNGMRRAQAELEGAVRAVGDALEEIVTSRESWEARLRERLVILAAAMAQKVIEHAHEQDPALFVQLAMDAVAAFPLEEAVRIRLNPADHAILSEGGHLERVVGERQVRWIPDEEMVPGGCIVEGPDKIVDGRVDEALVRIVRALTDG